MGAATAHPTEQILQAYGLGKLADAFAESVSKHLEDCSPCQKRVAEISSDSFSGRPHDAKGRPESPEPIDSSPAGQPATVGEPSEPASSRGHTVPSGLVDHPDYEVIAALGRGGMGVVYLAWNRLMARKEVLKVINRDLIERRGVLERFLREIRNAAQLHDPNIVTAYSAFRAGESLVFAMEHVEGEDLANYARAQGPLPVEHACYFIYQAALGLQYAHERGMVHRDIKPSNLILARQEKRAVVKVLDFGLAKATREGPEDNSLTREGQMLGTPDYIAPEQSLNAQKADIRADIYSLGCTLYPLLSGGPPFSGSSLYQVLQAHHSLDATPLNLVRPEVPAELAAMVGRMMAKEPERRFQTPGAVSQALKPFFKQGSSASAGSAAGVLQGGQPAVIQGTGAATEAKVEGLGIEHIGPPDSTKPELLEKGPLETAVTAAAPAVLEPAVSAQDRQRRLWLRPVAATGVILLGLAILWAVRARVFKSSNGVLVIENVPERATVDVDGETVFAATSGGEPVRIEARPGKHAVLVKSGNDLLLGERIIVESGKAVQLAVRTAPARDAVLVLENVPAGSVLEVDGDRVPPSSSDGGQVSTNMQPGKHVVVIKRGNDTLLVETVTLESAKRLALALPRNAVLVLENLPATATVEIDGDQLPARSAGAAAAKIEVRPGKHAVIVKRGKAVLLGESVALEPGSQFKLSVLTSEPSTAIPSSPLRPDSLTSRSTGITFVRLEGGEYMMGSAEDDKDAGVDEKPRHKVRIRPFYIGVFEVTQAQFQDVMKFNPSSFSPGGIGRKQVAGRSTARCPVEGVSWLDAVRFCNALSGREGLTPYYQVNEKDVEVPARNGPGYRLPTEAEWEYACRAGTTTRYSFGSDPSASVAYGWFSENSGGPHPVGDRLPNAFRLYDMHGNVWEWCGDGYATD
jgi:serine/threonine protein kinase/formylglycine-generating enzyme required for sulfatase activity